MNEFYSSPALTNLKQRVFRIEVIIPTQSAVRIRFRRNTHMILFFFFL
jgi:hypothetical protein